MLVVALILSIATDLVECCQALILSNIKLSP